MRAWRTAGRWTSRLEVLSRREFSLSSRVQKGQSIAEILRSSKNKDNLSVNGSVKSVRKQKRVAFAALGDGTTTQSLQAVLKPEDAAKYVGKTNSIAID
jgi:asparaginyl-tRNA synthetase